MRAFVRKRRDIARTPQLAPALGLCVSVGAPWIRQLTQYMRTVRGYLQSYRSFFRSLRFSRNSLSARVEVRLSVDVVIWPVYRESKSEPSLSFKLHCVCLKTAPIAFVIVVFWQKSAGYLSLTPDATSSNALGSNAN